MKRSFKDEPQTVSGMSFALRQPAEIGDRLRERLPVHISTMIPRWRRPARRAWW